MNNKGETLVESLISLLILTVIMVGFPSLLVSVTQMNQTIKESELSYSADKSTPAESIEVTITDLNDEKVYIFNDVNGYVDGDFYFYEQ